MNNTSWTRETAFDRAADLILDTIEEAFNLIPTAERTRAHAAIVNILEYYAAPKPGPDGTSAAEQRCNAGMYYIQNVGCVGNSARWWVVDGHGYTVDLNKAWRVSHEKALEICRCRKGEDIMRSCAEMDAIAQRHVDVQQIGGVRV